MSGPKRVRTPTVLQLEVVECGAACLAMVLAYFGRVVALEELREACGVSRDGSKASSILKASRRYGLVAKGFKKEPDQLLELPMPLVGFWNFNHFVVIEGVGKDTVWLNDPAVGPRKVSRAEFNESFTGVVLAFEPGEDFVKGGDRPSPLRALFSRLAGAQGALAFAVIASLGLVIPALVVPSLSRLFVDYYLVERLDGWLTPLALGVFGAAALRFALTWIQQRYLGRMAAKLALAGASRLAWRVVRLPVTFFAQRSSGEIGSRIGLTDRLAGLLAGGLALNCLNLISLIVFAAVMAQYDLPLTLLAILFGAATVGALWLLSRRIADVSQRQQMDEGKLLSTTIQGLSMVDSFKATGTEDLFFSRWAGAHAKVVNAEQDLGRLRRLVAALPMLFVNLSNAAILLVGGLRVMDGALTIGMLVAFQSLAASFFAPLIGLVGFGAQIQETRGALARIGDIEGQPLDPAFETPPPPPEGEAPAPTAAAEPRRLTGRMEARALSFGYAPLDPPIVDGFSFTLEPGARVALVGGSGGGKSTVGKLLAGLHPLWSGEVLLDGRPLLEIPRRALRGSLAYVDQEVAIFEGSIRDNITLWDDTLPEERVIAAAKDALIHADVMMRPGGYSHMVEEGGRNFSGGQRQRLALARALALDPSIILLDEATSALDSEVERQFMENLRRRGCACVIIAHRLSTIRDCDEILVLSQGRIIERGRHESLMAAGGAYKSLVES